ncbi:hypothetical protein TNCV_1488311 [Trichonephila clavipes]|nr:hypothetical protein TNCV_1488311 [Trichonephila clavipes]
MDDNTRQHRADIVNDCLRVKLHVWRGQHIRPTLIRLKIFGMLRPCLSSRFPTPATLIEAGNCSKLSNKQNGDCLILRWLTT